MPDDLTIRRLSAGDDADVMDAADLFDQPPRQPADRSLPARPATPPAHRLRAGRPVGFVSGVETTHPDKGTEMFVYELAVAADQRRRGIAKALLAELTTIARGHHCYDMWVLTDADNVAALAAYRSLRRHRGERARMLTWDWSEAPAR